MRRNPLTLFALTSTVLWILACSGEEEPINGVLDNLVACTGVGDSTAVDLDFDGLCVDGLCVAATTDESTREAYFDVDSACSDIGDAQYCESSGLGVVYLDDGDLQVAGFRLTDGFAAADETTDAGVGASWQCFIDAMGEDPDYIALEPTTGGHWITEMGWGELSDGTYEVWVLDYASNDGSEPDGTPDELRFWSVSATQVLEDYETDTESGSDTDTETDSGRDTFDTAR